MAKENEYKDFLHLKLLNHRTKEVNYSTIHLPKKGYIDIRKKMTLTFKQR